MKITKELRLDVVNAIAKGLPLTKALAATDCYSNSTVSHASVAIISAKPYRDTMRQYAETLAQTVGEQSIAAELELIRVGKAPFREVRAALQTIWRAYSAKVDGASVAEFKSQNGDQYAVIKKQVQDNYWSPQAQARIQEMREKAKVLQPGDLLAMAKVGLAHDLIDQPKDARARNANRRLAGEFEGAIGNNAGNLHLHAHSHSFSPMTAEWMARFLAEKHPEMGREEIIADVQAIAGASDAERFRWAQEERDEQHAMQREAAKRHAIDVIPERPDPLPNDRGSCDA